MHKNGAQAFRFARSALSALWRDPARRSAQAGAWAGPMVLETAEDDYHRLEVRDAATAAQVQRAERAIARAEPACLERAALGF